VFQALEFRNGGKTTGPDIYSMSFGCTSVIQLDMYMIWVGLYKYDRPKCMI